METAKLWIGGKWVKPQSGRTFATFNPTTGEEIAQEILKRVTSG